MEYVLTKKEGSIVDAKVTIDGEVWAKAQKKSFNKIAANVVVPGFRKGKLPLEMAKKYVDPRRVMQEALDLVLQPGYTHVLESEKENIEVMAQPDVTIEEISEEKVVVVYSLTVRPEVTLGAYEGLEVTRDDATVTSADIDAELTRLQNQNAELVESEEPVKVGDTVTLDFKGYVDGEAFEGGEAKDFDLVIGSGAFIPGFEDALVGATVGEKRDVVITFPENYVPALSGQEATFKCEIHKIKSKKLPELSDEFALDLNMDGVSTLEELKAHLEKTVATRKNAAADNKAYEELLTKIVDASSVEIPEKVLNQDIDSQVESLKGRVKEQGITFEQYLELTNSTVESVREQMRENCSNNLKKSFVLGKIAKDNGVSITDEDINSEFDRIAKLYNVDVEVVKNTFSKNIDGVVNEIFMRKIHELILAKNSVK